MEGVMVKDIASQGVGVASNAYNEQLVFSLGNSQET